MTYSLTLTSSTFPITATATFPAIHPAFQGHFPNHPILPAFMHIQSALDTLKCANFPHTLKEIPVAKFITPIPPDHLIDITINENYNVILHSNHQTHSTFTLTVV